MKQMWLATESQLPKPIPMTTVQNELQAGNQQEGFVVVNVK